MCKSTLGKAKRNRRVQIEATRSPFSLFNPGAPWKFFLLCKGINFHILTGQGKKPHNQTELKNKQKNQREKKKKENKPQKNYPQSTQEHLRYKLPHVQTKFRHDNLICVSQDTYSQPSLQSVFTLQWEKKLHYKEWLLNLIFHESWLFT